MERYHGTDEPWHSYETDSKNWWVSSVCDLVLRGIILYSSPGLRRRPQWRGKSIEDEIFGTVEEAKVAALTFNIT